MSIWTTDEANNVLNSRSFTMSCTGTVTRAGEVLADNIPIAGGREECDALLRVPERVTLTIPRTAGGVSWAPDSPDSPLAPYGQRLHVRIGIGAGPGITQYVDRGEFLIQDVTLDDDQVTVNAVGLLALINEARLIAPFRPASTIAATLRALVEPALTVKISSGLNDRSVPSDINLDEDRLQAVLDLLDAWGARGRINAAGYLDVLPGETPGDLTTLSVLKHTIPDQVYGFPRANVDQLSAAASRDGIVNTIVARGNAADGGQVQGVAYATTGPAAYPGSFNPLPVPDFFYSPMLTTNAQCVTAARTILARKSPSKARSWDVTCVPDPRIELGDIVNFYPDASLYGPACRVQALALPYTADSGPMTLRLQEVFL